MKQKQTAQLRGENLNKTKYIAKVGVLSALAMLIMLIEFPLPFAPGFYKLDLSEIPVLIGGFSMGPVAGILIELIKNLLKLAVKGTETAFVGELANFLIGCAFVIPASLLYRLHRKKTRTHAIVGLIVGTLIMTVIGAVFNYAILIPFYARFYGMPLDAIVAMGSAVNRRIVDVRTLVVFATVPFNLLKGTVCSVITALIYKYISPVLKRFS